MFTPEYEAVGGVGRGGGNQLGVNVKVVRSQLKIIGRIG